MNICLAQVFIFLKSNFDEKIAIGEVRLNSDPVENSQTLCPTSAQQQQKNSEVEDKLTGMITSQRLVLPHLWRGLAGKISPSKGLKTISCMQEKTLSRFYSCYKNDGKVRSIPMVCASGSYGLCQGYVPRYSLINRQLWLAGVTQDRGYRYVMYFISDLILCCIHIEEIVW